MQTPQGRNGLSVSGEPDQGEHAHPALRSHGRVVLVRRTQGPYEQLNPLERCFPVRDGLWSVIADTFMLFAQDTGEAQSFFTGSHNVRLFPPIQASKGVVRHSAKLGLDRTLFWYSEHLKSMFQLGRKRKKESDFLFNNF